MPDVNPLRSTVNDSRQYDFQIAGAGATDPTVNFGRRLTCTRTSTGLYALTWSQSPGATFIRMPQPGLRTSGSAAALAQTNVVAGIWDPVARTLPWSLFVAGVLTDLAAGQFLDFSLLFSDLASG